MAMLRSGLLSIMSVCLFALDASAGFWRLEQETSLPDDPPQFTDECGILGGALDHAIAGAWANSYGYLGCAHGYAEDPSSLFCSVSANRNASGVLSQFWRWHGHDEGEIELTAISETAAMLELDGHQTSVTVRGRGEIQSSELSRVVSTNVPLQQATSVTGITIPILDFTIPSSTHNNGIVGPVRDSDMLFASKCCRQLFISWKAVVEVSVFADDFPLVGCACEGTTRVMNGTTLLLGQCPQ